MRQDTPRRLQEPPKSLPEPSKRRPTGLQDLPSGLPIRGRRQEGVSPLNPATELCSSGRGVSVANGYAERTLAYRFD